MKNKILYFVAIGALSLSLSGCGKDFLVTEPKGSLSGEQLNGYTQLESESVQYMVNGVYYIMRQEAAGGLPNDQTDFGQKAVDIDTDMMSMVITKSSNNYGWYNDYLTLAVGNNAISLQNYKHWRFYFKVVRGANQIINTLPDEVVADPSKISEETKLYYAQAYALRAYAYLNLLRLYSTEYKPEETGLPIYTSEEQSAQPFSLQKEIFEFIEKDLKTAISLFEGEAVLNKTDINKYIAETLLAYAYATVGQYDKIEELAQDVIANSGSRLAGQEELLGGFNSIHNNDSWLWGGDVTSDSPVGLVSFWGHLDYFSYSYTSAGDYMAINKELYASIPETDVRKQQFHPRVLISWQKFFDPSRKQGGTSQVSENDLVYLRIEEMYLLQMEAAAFMGNIDKAKELLKAFVSTRNTDTSFIDALATLDDVKNEIYHQWRIEMWGEGKSYFAMKRFKATVTVPSNCYVTPLRGIELRYDDPVINFVIPQNEEDNNPLYDRQQSNDKQ